MEVKESMQEGPEAPNDDMEVDVPIDGFASNADQALPEDNDWGDAGEGEGFDVGFDED